jgi:hypothetical protein
MEISHRLVSFFILLIEIFLLNYFQRKFTCDFDGHCEVNINTRHLCTACRLAKCLNCGMSCDLFRAPKRKEIKTKLLVQTSVQHQPELVKLLKRKANDLIILFFSFQQ